MMISATQEFAARIQSVLNDGCKDLAVLPRRLRTSLVGVQAVRTFDFHAMEKQVRQNLRAEPQTDKPGNERKGAKREQSGQEFRASAAGAATDDVSRSIHTHWDAADRPSSSLLG